MTIFYPGKLNNGNIVTMTWFCQTCKTSTLTDTCGIDRHFHRSWHIHQGWPALTASNVDTVEIHLKNILYFELIEFNVEEESSNIKFSNYHMKTPVYFETVLRLATEYFHTVD